MEPTTELAQVEQKAENAAQIAQLITITDDEGFTYATEQEAGLRALLKEIDAGYDPLIESTRASWELARKTKESRASQVEYGIKILKGKLIAYSEARKRGNEIRQAVAESEETKKLKAEREESARMLRDMGLNEQADALLNEPLPTAQAVVAAPPPLQKAEGSSFKYRSNWTFKVMCNTCKTKVLHRDIDKNHDGHEIEVKDIPLEYWYVLWTRISKEVKDKKLECKIPGITVIEEKV